MSCGIDRRRFVAAAVAACVTSAQADKVDNPTARYWRRRVAEFLNDSPSRNGIVFLGDSMTERFDLAVHFGPEWAGQLINRGIGGDKVGGWHYLGLLDRLEDTVLALRPRQVVLMIGVNDIVFAATPRDTLLGSTDELLTRLAQAPVPAVVQSVLPTRGSYARHNAAIADYNRQLALLAARHGQRWLDLGPGFADALGHLRPGFAVDDIHLSQAGYREWAARLQPLLRR